MWFAHEATAEALGEVGAGDHVGEGVEGDADGEPERDGDAVVDGVASRPGCPSSCGCVGGRRMTVRASVSGTLSGEPVVRLLEERHHGLGEG